jgi:hypothetical protein
MKIVAMLAFAAVLAACGSSGTHSESEPISATRPTVHHVVYFVDGTARGADLTLSTPTGLSQQSADVPVINRQGLRGLRFVFPPGARLYLSAQNSGVGSIDCRIEVDGKIVSRNESAGAYSIVTCQGTT